MAVVSKTAQQIYAPVDENGAPRPISPQEAGVWGTEMERLVSALAYSVKASVVRGTKADLDAVVGQFDDGAVGLVVIDPVAALRGIYRRASGVWVKQADLPEDVASAAAATATQKAAEASQDRALAQAARDVAAGYGSDAVSQGNVPIYATRAGMPGISVPNGINAFRVNGDGAAGDGGESLYKSVGAKPANAVSVQTADGRWWQKVGNYPGVVGAALTLTSGTPSPTVDAVGATVLYVTPTGANTAEVFTDGVWASHRFAEISVALNPAVHGDLTNFWVGVAVVDGILRAGTFAWSTAAMANRDGRVVNRSQVTLVNGADSWVVPANECLLIGGFRTSGAGMTENSTSKRFVSNLYHRSDYVLERKEAAAQWVNTAGSVWTPAKNGDARNAVSFFQAFDGGVVEAEVSAYVENSTAVAVGVSVGIGVNSITTNDATFTDQVVVTSNPGGKTSRAKLVAKLGPGYHRLTWMEFGVNTGGLYQTWTGTGGLQRSGLFAKISN